LIWEKENKIVLRLFRGSSGYLRHDIRILKKNEPSGWSGDPEFPEKTGELAGFYRNFRSPGIFQGFTG
jgi:hypothetical protein